MKNLLIIFSFLLIAIVAKGEGKDHFLYEHMTVNTFALTGSGSLDIDPLLNLNACTGSGTIDLNFVQDIDDTILWNDGSDDVKRVGLGSGDYFVDLTINGCDTTIFFMLDFPELLTSNVENVSNKNCIDGSLGSFSVGLNGGEGPYTYSLNNQPIEETFEFTGLEEGVYTVDITDANGCQTQVTQTIKCVGCKISGNPVRSGEDFFVDVFFGDESETAELSIYNSNGRKVRGPIDIPVTNGEVNSFPVTADLSAGMYVVLIKGESISFSRQLVVVE